MKRLLTLALVPALLIACKTTEEKPETDQNAGRIPPVEAFRASPPAPGPEPAISLPTFETAKLKNGMTIYVANASTLPIVDVGLVVAAGAAHEDVKQAGLASLTYDLLDEGAGKLNALAFADAVADLGASISVGSGRESGSASMSLLKRNLDAGVELMSTLARSPTFSDADFKRIQKQTLSSLKARSGNPSAISADLFNAAVFGDAHPYGHPVSGTVESVTALKVKDVKAYWSKNAGPSTSALIFSGNITLSDATAIAEKHFGSWKSSAKRNPAPADPEAGGAKILVANVDKAPQTVVRIGRALIKRGDPDEWSLEVMNRMLGGMFSSRLNMKLREEKQFTYGAGSRLSATRGTGPWAAAAGIKTEHTVEALKDFFGEFDRLKSEPPDEAELAAAKDNLIKSFPARFETVSAITRAASELFIYDLPTDYFAKIPAAVESVTLDQVKAAAERALQNDAMMVVLVGDKAQFESDLGGLGLGEVVVVER